MVYQLIYVSCMAQVLSKEALAEIARHSQKNNRARNISGVMLVHNGSVLQILEGEQSDVETLYAKICCDPRHTQIIVMSRRKIEKREFEDWSMGFKYIDADSPESALFKFTQEALNKITSSDKSQEVRAFSQSFARVSGF